MKFEPGRELVISLTHDANSMHNLNTHCIDMISVGVDCHKPGTTVCITGK